MVPWWSEECQQAVRERNRAFKLVKKTLSQQHLFQYKKAQALLRKTVRRAKRVAWRGYCSGIGRTTLVGEVWGMIKKMGGDRREWGYPVLQYDEETAISDGEKAELMARSFSKVHDLENLSEEGIRRREATLSLYSGMVGRKERGDDILDEPFTLAEMVRAINKSKPTSPGKDRVCYKMMQNLWDEALGAFLFIYL